MKQARQPWTRALRIIKYILSVTKDTHHATIIKLNKELWWGKGFSYVKHKEVNIMVVQHNLTAMNSNRMLGITSSTQAKSTEKLSSGYKINRAADDAAGLSISEKMRRQIRGLSQASLNAADGISCVQTAEGALNEVHDMLQRINELAVKGENGTLTSTDRQYIQSEVKQLMSEIDRVQSTTTFNEQNLLDGSFSNKGLMVGAEAGQHIGVTIGNMSTNELIGKALSDGVKFKTNHIDDQTGYCCCPNINCQSTNYCIRIFFKNIVHKYIIICCCTNNTLNIKITVTKYIR